ncbi:hypothetical protein [Allorhodopirellula heiligendammensis]|nr:hypothetical protein [Allorhodopirellula heiligendammensis]
MSSINSVTLPAKIAGVFAGGDVFRWPARRFDMGGKSLDNMSQ